MRERMSAAAAEGLAGPVPMMEVPVVRGRRAEEVGAAGETGPSKVFWYRAGEAASYRSVVAVLSTLLSSQTTLGVERR